MIVLENNSTVKKSINEYRTRITRVNGREAVEVQITAVWKTDKLLGIVNVWDSVFFLDTGTYCDYRTRVWNGIKNVIVADESFPIGKNQEREITTVFDQRIMDYCKKIGGIRA